LYNQEIQQSSGTNPRFFYGYTIVVAAFFIMLISMGTYTSFGVFLKPIMSEFGWTSAMTSGALSLSLVAIALLGIGMGGLNDRFGPRVVVSLSGFFFGLGYLLLSQVNAVWHLYLFYGLIIGTAVSSTWVPLLSTVAKWFTKTRSFVTGIVMAGVSMGGLIVPLVAVQFIFAFGWRTSYLLLGIIILVIVVSAAQFLRRDKEQVGLIRNGSNGGEKLGPEFRTEGLSLNKAVHRRQFWFLFFASFCSGFCIWTVLVHIVPHAIELGFSPATASTILATISGLSIAGRIVLGPWNYGSCTFSLSSSALHMGAPVWHPRHWQPRCLVCGLTVQSMEFSILLFQWEAQLVHLRLLIYLMLLVVMRWLS
jgi:sugar phosphate permease